MTCIEREREREIYIYIYMHVGAVECTVLETHFAYGAKLHGLEGSETSQRAMASEKVFLVPAYRPEDAPKRDPFGGFRVSIGVLYR